MNELPIYSRCKSGKKWFWVVFQSYGAIADCEPPIAEGYAASESEALEAATRAVGYVEQVHAKLASYARKMATARKRMARQAVQSDATRLEFVYECGVYYSDEPGPDEEYANPHRIIKRTKKRVFVERHRYIEGRQRDASTRDYITETFALDREALERDGKVRGGRRFGIPSNWYLDPEIFFRERRERAGMAPPCFSALGLAGNATADDVRAAYLRLATETHPDRGGDAKRFTEVRAAYEQALAVAMRKGGAA